MTHKKIWLGMAAMILSLGLVLVGCNIGSDISGTWKGNIGGYNATVTISKIGWSMSIPGYFTDTGTYMRDGNTGRFTSDNGGRTIGIGERLDAKTIKITLNANSFVQGTYTLTRTDGKSSGGNTATESDFKVSLLKDGKSLEITKYVGEKKVINIPSHIEGKNVTIIGAGAFFDYNEKEKYKEITKVIIPKSVTYIGKSAFLGCTGLASITIPASVTAIDEWAFTGCISLTKITVDGKNPNYTSKGGMLFNKEKNLLIAYPTASGTVTIPAGVSIIGKGAFDQCTKLTSVNIPVGVTEIEHSAFRSCTGLTSVTIPNSVTSIGSAFYGCTGLTSITIPANVASISIAFLRCNSLTSITVDINNPNYASEGGILYNKAKTTLIAFPSASGSVTIPASVTSIGGSAFSGCDNLSNITLPEGLTSIGGNAFFSCKNLTNITIPANVMSIDKDAFYNWTASQTINVQGKANQSAADRAWGADWRRECKAKIIYLGK